MKNHGQGHVQILKSEFVCAFYSILKPAKPGEYLYAIVWNRLFFPGDS